MRNVLVNLQNHILILQNLFNDKQFIKIEQLSKSLLIRYDDSFDINLIIGTSYLTNKKLDMALNLLLKANMINPSSCICLLNIAICYKLLKKLNKYKQYLDLAYFSEPNNVQVICELGFFHLHVHEIQLSISYYEKVIKYKKNDTNFVLNISQCYLRSGNSNRVIDICLNYVKGGNINSLVFNTLAIAYKAMGDFKSAKLYFCKSIKITPNYLQAHRNLSSLINYKIANQHLLEMEDLYKDYSTSIELNLALSKAYKDINENHKYFKHLEFANKSIKKSINYKPEDEKIKFSRIKSIFSKKNSESDFTDYHNLSPIFILGLPRSGTTLVENIISSHSKVFAGGEMDTLDNLGNQILNRYSPNYNLNEDSIIKCRQYYIKSISNLNNKASYITDKMPLNFLWIGLIFSCFPRAKIIHLIRNPIATCWSLFNTYFSGNGNSFSYSQNDIYDYFNLYLDLMKHWNNIYPNQIFNLNYENLVTSPNKEIKSILQYCMLNSENSCFSPHLNRRQVSTASSLQVRKKIYSGSKNNWKIYKDYISKDILFLDSNN